MAIRTQPDIYVCDRCGHETTDRGDLRGSVKGSLSIKWGGSKGGVSYAGDWGGVNLKGDAWLCMTCTDDFLAFMNGDN